MAAPALVTIDHSPVKDISIIGEWDPHGDPATANVMIYTKVVPQPSTKVALLHLQPLVLQSTLVRVVPLLPDGSSPWESPGVEALNVPIVAGRKRAGTSFRKVKYRLDGADSVDDESTLDTPSPLERISTMRHAPDSDGDESTYTTAPDPEGLEELKHSYADEDSTLLPIDAIDFSNPLANFATDGNSSLDKVGIQEPLGFHHDVDVSFRRDVELGADGIEDEKAGHALEKLAPTPFPTPNTPINFRTRCVSYSRDRSGGMRKVPVDVYDWEKINLCASKLHKGVMLQTTARGRVKSDSPRVDSSGRIFSSGSFSSIREASPIPGSMVEKLKRELGGVYTPEIGDVSPLGQDGANELKDFKDKYKESLKGLKKLFSDEHEDQPSERDISISVEKNTLFLCFPSVARDDAVVVEVMVTVKPIVLGQSKNYYTFIFSGLPYCRKVAYFSFKVYDSTGEEWVFDVGDHEQTSLFQPLMLEEQNRVRGQLHLTDATPTQRSVILRARHVPSHIEIYNYKIRTKTNALFSWASDGKVTGEFEIKVSFFDVEVAESFARNLVNLIFINGTDNAEDITITSASGKPERFSFEGPVIKDGQMLISSRLLQVSRRLGDVRDSMTISFRVVQSSAPHYFSIPLVETGSHKDLLEQVVVIHEPCPPLALTFTPDTTYWEDLNEEQDLPGSRKISRLVHRVGVEYPRVFISSLEPVEAVAAQTLSKSAHLGFIDKLTYEVQEHSPWQSYNPRPLRLRMSFEFQISSSEQTELLKMDRGSFQLEFATINGAPAKMLFMDDDELVMLNYGQVYANEPARFEIYWMGMQALTVSAAGGTGKQLEFQMPRIRRNLIGRVVCQYPIQQGAEPTADVRLSSRSHFVQPGSWTASLVDGRATMWGLQTFNSRLYLQVPFAPWHKKSRSRASSTATNSRETPEGLSLVNAVFDNASSLDGAASMRGLSSFDGTGSPPSSVRRRIVVQMPPPLTEHIEQAQLESIHNRAWWGSFPGPFRVAMMLGVIVAFLSSWVANYHIDRATEKLRSLRSNNFGSVHIPSSVPEMTNHITPIEGENNLPPYANIAEEKDESTCMFNDILKEDINKFKEDIDIPRIWTTHSLRSEELGSASDGLRPRSGEFKDIDMFKKNIDKFKENIDKFKDIDMFKDNRFRDDMFKKDIDMFKENADKFKDINRFKDDMFKKHIDMFKENADKFKDVNRFKDDMFKDINRFKDDMFKEDTDMFKEDIDMFKEDIDMFKEDTDMFKEDTNMFKVDVDILEEDTCVGEPYHSQQPSGVIDKDVFSVLEQVGEGAPEDERVEVHEGRRIMLFREGFISMALGFVGEMLGMLGQYWLPGAH